MTLTNATFSGDSVQNGAGSYDFAPTYQSNGADIFVNGDASLKLINSIAANGTGGSQIADYGAFSGSNNLLTSSIGVPSSAIVSTANPNLRTLANYGGPIPTMVLVDGSPALGAALVSALTTLDARGFTRPDQTKGDLGATQLRRFVVSSANDSGAGSLRQTLIDDLDLTPITFSSTLLNKTITLTSGPLILTRDATILDLNTYNITISGNGLVRVFVVNSGVTAVINGLTIANGRANVGGAILNSGILSLNNDTFTKNNARGDTSLGFAGLGAGGAIYSTAGSILTVTNSLFLNNNATGADGTSSAAAAPDGRASGKDAGSGLAGAIYGDTASRLTISNDTFSGNVARGGGAYSSSNLGGSGYGGAVVTYGPTTITNSTFSGQQTIAGPGQSAFARAADILNKGPMTLVNSIGANGTSDVQIINQGTLTGSNNIFTSSTGVNAGIIASSADPLLSPLASNGGVTQNYALKAGSYALGNGLASSVAATDQRSQPRVVGGRVDIGSYQTQFFLTKATINGPYLAHVGQTIPITATVLGDSAGASLTYTTTWTITGNGITPIVQTTTSTTFTATPTLNLATTNLAAGTYQIALQVSDGYGTLHTAADTDSFTLLPILQVTAITTQPPASNTPFDTADFTLNVYPTVAKLTSTSIALTLNGGPNLLSSSIFTKNFAVTAVDGAVNTYRISGLTAIMIKNGQGRYSLTVNGGAITDYYTVAGTGSLSASWVYDTLAPTSKLATLPARTMTPGITVTASGSDPIPGVGVPVSGVAAYVLNVSVDGGAFAYWTTVPASTPSATYTDGLGGHSYAFQSFAVDGAGNAETKPMAVEAATFLFNTTPPAFAVTSVDSSTKNFVVTFTGSVGYGLTLDHVDVYVTVDGGSPVAIGRSAGASGSVNYSALVDGKSHTYGFFAIGTDSNGNVEPAPTAPAYDQQVTATFGNPQASLSPAPTGLTVNRGAIGRSFVRYVDLIFTTATNLASLITGGKVHLTKHALDGTGSTPVTLGSNVLNVVDHAIEFDFGALGLGSDPDSTAADGYYEVAVDGATDHYFFDRLFGDVNGDRVVDSTDVNLVSTYLGTTTSQVDIDGKGLVSTLGRTLVQKARGHMLATGLRLDA